MENEEIKPGQTYLISVQWGLRQYKNYEKSFNDEKHYENWYDFIASRGGKVIGIIEKK